jgi:phage terminase large subunit GpA-like protein
VLTAGADVQADRVEVEGVAWGPERESWSVDYVVLPGDPAEPEVWHELERVLKRPYPMVGVERELRIKLAAIDAGYLQTHVVEACRRIGRYLAIPIKGRDKYPQLVGVPTAVEVKRAGKRIKRGGKLWPLGTDIAKHELYANLRQMPPAEGEQTPHGFAHFPEYAEEYFRQLCAEQCTPHIVKGSGGTAPRRVYAWEKIRERNEALDCRVYARAAAAIVGVDRWGAEDWLALASGATSANTPKAKPDKPKPPRRRGGGPKIDPDRWRGRR